MKATEHERLLRAIRKKRITEQDQERFGISEKSAVAYNMALDSVIETIEEDFGGDEE